MKRALLSLALGAVALGALAQSGTPAAPLAELQARVDGWVLSGYEQPAPALAALTTELARREGDADATRVLQLGRGLVAAAASLDDAAADALAALERLGSDPLSAADAALVGATLADSKGDSGPASAAAKAALDGYRSACPAAPGCDYRSSWRALQLLVRHEELRGLSSSARDRAREAVDLAKAAGDVARHAWALALAADAGTGDGKPGGEQRLLEQALRLASQAGSPALLARVRVHETRMLSRRGHVTSALAAAQAGLALAQQAKAPRLAAVFQANLSDLLIKAARPQAALQAVEDALPVARRFRDRRTERVLVHNAALARVALGQTEVAQHVLEDLLASYRVSGGSGAETEALREFADAFANAGHLREALALYHRERKLAAAVMAANREAALAELTKRFDREAQQRQLEQLARDNALIGLQIDNRAATQKVWFAAALLLALAMGAVAMLYRRVRAVNRSLAHSQAFLRAQSQRDPLTGLANRRGLHDLAAAQQLELAFSGALLLIDIDHFKRVNDGHGHAAGDVVLVEVSRRLAEVVREDDLVVRWGGEEFLVYMPGVTLEQAQALAERALQAVGATPVTLPTGPLRVTVSVGYACFPLPKAMVALSLDRAINFADMALYTAKNQGRNRAIGIASTTAIDAPSLRAIEADFDRAWHGGQVTLVRGAGPVASRSAGESATQPA
jgi:diguanylate cyclase (GGDEF)-like protein